MSNEVNDTTAATVAAVMLVKCAEFNEKIIGLPIPEKATVLGPERAAWALTALNEELKEFETATGTANVEEAADALIDLVYFALGRLVEMGVPAVAVFEEVQRANMEKTRGELSKRPYSKGFDAVKPKGWTGPDHSWLLGYGHAELENAKKWEKLSPVFKRISDLRETKGSDYNNVPGGRDAYFPFGHYSYAHMIHTKELRLQSLLKSLGEGRKPNYEGILDTVEDLVNYATFYAEKLRDGSLSEASA